VKSQFPNLLRNCVAGVFSGTFGLTAHYGLGGNAAFQIVFFRRNPMSSTSDKIKGAANEAMGNVKQAAGKAVGNDRLVVKGALQERKGEVQQAVGKAKSAVKKVIDG
jgi:uncharacterized protein YjbJ (UPF0337 family)